MTRYNVFVSHSMTQEDLGIIYQTKRDAECRGITCYVAERDPQFEKHSLARSRMQLDHATVAWCS